MSDSLVVNEIYLSVQGESTFAGLPCVFVRLTGCNLRCSYCDTVYAFTEGQRRSVGEIESEVKKLASPYCDKVKGHKIPLVELTGGEPLLQKGVIPLMNQLCDSGFTTLIETSGAHDISVIDQRVRRVMDLKCPSSGECDRNLMENIHDLRETDEVKFVIGTTEDYDWAKGVIAEHGLAKKCPLLFSWVSPLEPHQQDRCLKPVPPAQNPISRKDLVDQIIADALPVRFQLQMHKFIWPPDERGV